MTDFATFEGCVLQYKTTKESRYRWFRTIEVIPNIRTTQDTFKELENLLERAGFRLDHDQVGHRRIYRNLSITKAKWVKLKALLQTNE